MNRRDILKKIAFLPSLGILAWKTGPVYLKWDKVWALSDRYSLRNANGYVEHDDIKPKFYSSCDALNNKTEKHAMEFEKLLDTPSEKKIKYYFPSSELKEFSNKGKSNIEYLYLYKNGKIVFNYKWKLVSVMLDSTKATYQYIRLC